VKQSQDRLATGEFMQKNVRKSSAKNLNNILEVIRTNRDQLRKAERKVADVVLSNPQDMLSLTVAEIAVASEVSQPTVLRFCAALECKGFLDFKLRLSSSLAIGTPATHSAITTDDDVQNIMTKIFEYTMSSLDWVRSHIDHEQLSAAVDLLESANRIEFIGFGASGIVAHDAAQKFPLFDVPCGAETDLHQQIMLVSMMKPGDVVVIISNTASTRSLIDVAREARRVGAKVLGIVGHEGALSTCFDTTLIVETLENTNIYTPTTSRIAALAIIDVLSISVALRKSGDHAARFESLKRNLSYLKS